MPAGHPPLGDAAPATGEAVAGTVELAPALRPRADAGAVLFVVARRAGTREILAVKREGSVRLPHAFELSGRDGMTGTVAFTGTVDVTARLSRSGDAIPAAGDLEGVVHNVPVGRRGVKVVIDTTRP
jgi:cytochrome c-type biogenesis protein CcmH